MPKHSFGWPNWNVVRHMNCKFKQAIVNRINSFLHLPFQLHTCLHSSCFMSNDIQLLLLGCESTRCHMDIILRRLCIKENVHGSGAL